MSNDLLDRDLTPLPRQIVADPIAARRMRRAFRRCVMFIMLFTAMMWFAEWFLRYDQSERLYISALTLDPQSARPLLIAAIKSEKRTRETPTPKYVQALAERMEREDILSGYEDAIKADPNNAGVTLRYGCQMALAERWPDAQTLFAKAAQLDQGNALPVYLEAAAIAMGKGNENAVDSAIELVARANGGNRPSTLPRPQWSSVLPADGMWYAELTRKAAEECLAPLYRFSFEIARRAKQDTAPHRFYYWNNVLASMEGMGRHLAFSALFREGGDVPGRVTERPVSGAMLQLIAGLSIQRDALGALAELTRRDPKLADPALDKRLETIQTVRDKATEFERTRDSAIEADRARRMNLIRWSGNALVAALAGLLLSIAIFRFFRVRPALWALPHTPYARAVFGGGALWLLALLVVATLLENAASSASITKVLGVLWGISVAGWLGFGFVYPFFALRYDRGALQDLMETPVFSDKLPKDVTQLRRMAWACLFRRYFGVVAGLLPAIISLWVLLFRFEHGLYPWQLNLLTTGLVSEEIAAVQRLLIELGQ